MVAVWCPRHIPLAAYGSGYSAVGYMGDYDHTVSGLVKPRVPSARGCEDCRRLRAEERERKRVARKKLLASKAGWPLVRR